MEKKVYKTLKMICPNCHTIHNYDGHRDFPLWCKTCTLEAMRFAWLDFEEKYWSKWTNEEKYKHMSVPDSRNILIITKNSTEELYNIKDFRELEYGATVV